MRIFWLRYFISIPLFVVFVSGYAASNSADLIFLLDSVKTMKADFSQTIYDNHGKAVETSYGSMAMQRPGKFRWEVKKPIPQLIIANESKLWIYDPDLQQVTIRVLGKASGGSPALLLSHVNTTLDKDFLVKPLAKKMAGWSWFELVPKQQDSMFASIEMGFTNKQIREMRLQDHLGHTTLVKFANAFINKSLPASLFTLKIPANADVIDETRARR
jgi:outer membrane lipoprotein carrier protein